MRLPISRPPMAVSFLGHAIEAIVVHFQLVQFLQVIVWQSRAPAPVQIGIRQLAGDVIALSVSSVIAASLSDPSQSEPSRRRHRRKSRSLPHGRAHRE